MSRYPARSRTRVGAVMLAGALVLAPVSGQAAAEAAGPGPTSRAETAGVLARSAPAVVAASSAYNSTVLADRPVGFWYDAHGRELVGGRDATRVGTPGTTRLPNGDSAATFDGTRRYLEVADDDRWSPATTGVFTIEAWVRPSTLHFTSGNFENCYVHWLGKGVPEQHEWTLRMYSDVTPCETPQRPNRTSVYAFNSSGGLGTGAYFQGGLNGVPAMRAGQWVHVVGVINARQRSGTYPNGYVKIYRNGRLINTRDLSSTVPIDLRNGSAPVRIGTRDLGSFFQGAIGKVALYTHEVPPSRVLAHYDAMRPSRTPAPVPPASAKE
jgi:hypothetical protein